MAELGRREGRSVPLTIISGFLGAGKTTIINSLVQKQASVRTGLLVNDFAEINIDAELIRNNLQQNNNEDGGALVELSNGCVCCSISGELQYSIEKVLGSGVEHIIVETSGVSDPTNIVDTLLLPQLRSLVWLSGIVVVVDGESIVTTLESSISARKQLLQADVVVLNKTDLLSGDEYDKVKEVLKKAAPDQYNIIPSQYGNIPTSVVYGLNENQLAAAKKRHPPLVKSNIGGADEMVKMWEGLSHQPHSNHKEEIGGLMTMSYSRKGATFNLSRFQSFMANHFPKKIVRAKGFLHFDCSPKLRYVLQLSGKKRFDASSEEISDQVEDPPGIEFVFIGFDLEKNTLIDNLDQCLASSEDTKTAEKGCAEEVAAFIQKDVRFEVRECSYDSFPSLVLFQLKHTRWHGMSTSDMNRALLSTINSKSSESGLFLTHITEPDFLLRLDTAGWTSSPRDIWRAIQSATEGMLTNVFMNTFCCGIR